MGIHRIGVIGLGKIAQDQHLPVIAKSAAFELAAVSSQRGLTAGEALAFREPRGAPREHARSRRGRGLHAAAGAPR